MKKDNNFAIIMAGGIGSRFWPLSDENKPKQFIDILGTGKTLIQQTYDRLKQVCPEKNILVVTSNKYVSIVKDQLKDITENNILAEPYRRNTAPCIAYASYKIFLKCKTANIIVAPSDHIIMEGDIFKQTLVEGINFVENNDMLLTLGIVPNRPETGYGYIQINKGIKGFNHIKNVKTFTEKPNKELAEVFLKSGDFLWNSGIFLWNVNTILKAFKEYLPNLVSLFKNGLGYLNTNKESEFISNVYAETHAISIDYGILEKANNVCVLSSDFGWSDLGTWRSFHELNTKDDNNNVIYSSNYRLIDTKNCIINLPSDKKIIIQGLDNFIIAEQNNNILICNRDNEKYINQYTDSLKAKEAL